MDEKKNWLVKGKFKNNIFWDFDKPIEITSEELELLKNHLKWNDTNPLLIKRLGTLEQRIALLKKLEAIK